MHNYDLFKTWFNLTERALNQCNEFHNAAENSKGQLRLITNKAELNQYIEDRAKNKLITAGMLGIEARSNALSNDLNNLAKLYTAELDTSE